MTADTTTVEAQFGSGPILLKSRKSCRGKILAKAYRQQISSEDRFFMRRRTLPKGSVQVDAVHRV
jgi:hypothetical protein